MAAVSARKDAAIRVRSERQRILQELAREIEASETGVLELVAYGSLEIVIVDGHVKTIKVIASVQTANLLPLTPTPATA